MCGIFCFITRNEDEVKANKNFKLCEEVIRNRGPDAFQKLQIQLTEEWSALFSSSVLWTQGAEITVQPIFNEDILLWNGDSYSETETGLGEKSDSEVLFLRMKEDCIGTLRNVCGPYAFIFWSSKERKLYFGRDVLGRHSLLWSLAATEILLTSTGNSTLTELEEVQSSGIHVIDLSKPDFELELFPWNNALEIPMSFPDKNLPINIREEAPHNVLHSARENVWLEKDPTESDLALFQGINCHESSTQAFEVLYKRLEKSLLVEQLKGLLFESVKVRVKTKPEYCTDCITNRTQCGHSKIGILFSGGLDSSILSLVASKFVPRDEPIDLYNVAFERSEGDGFDVPDRITGLMSLEELSRLSPDRKWNFIQIDITQGELSSMRKKRVQHLIHPLKSILDDSLGCALWFAARGKGLLNGKEYISSARVLLLGMGADEIFGGYSRHRKIFNKEGWIALGRELDRELWAISRRNLGRDNRVVGDHGKQPRTPFLDEHLVSFVHQLPPWRRCWLTPELPPGVGDKLLLRSLACDLGFTDVAMFPKRALQFGTRIANPKEKGHEISQRLRLKFGVPARCQDSLSPLHLSLLDSLGVFPINHQTCFLVDSKEYEAPKENPCYSRHKSCKKPPETPRTVDIHGRTNE